MAPACRQLAAVDHHHLVAHALHVVEQVGGHERRDAEAGQPARPGRASPRGPIGSSPAVGSSSSTTSGSATIAWASFVRWRMPVEKPPIGRNRASSRPTRSSTSEARWRAARGGRPASSPKVPTTSAAVWSGGRQSCSGMKPMWARTPTGSSATARRRDLDRARGGLQQAERQAQQRRLAGSVGTDQAHGAAGDLDGQLVERDGAPRVAEREPLGAQQTALDHGRDSSGTLHARFPASPRRVRTTISMRVADEPHGERSAWEVP